MDMYRSQRTLHGFMYTGIICVVDRDISKKFIEAVSMSNQKKGNVSVSKIYL